MSGTPVIETHRLRRHYGSTVAVADLSLTVQPGEVFGFLGPNGAGKTTSIKMLLSLVPPTGGTATLMGRPLGDAHARARVGFLPEHFRFHDAFTARELLRFHGRLHGLRGQALEARIVHLIERVALSDAIDRPVHGFSKGMLQRVGLAQALVNDPALVFLDEPTSGLDPLGRRLVRQIVADLKAQGATVFLNSHLLGEVEATCDRVAFVKQGRVVHELRLGAEVAHLDVEVRARPVGAALLDGLSRFGQGVHAAGPDLVRLRIGSDDVLPDLHRWLASTGVDVYGVRATRKSLEDWFVDVMGHDQAPG